jgi:hypothetical protein
MLRWTYETEFPPDSKDASTLLVLVLVWLAMLASNVDDMTSHETSNIKTIANKLKYDYSLYTHGSSRAEA